MNWIIVVTMSVTEPFSIPTLKFETKPECVEYVMNPENSDRLAIEVIAKAGFNEEVTAVLCLPEINNTLTRKSHDS